MDRVLTLIDELFRGAERKLRCKYLERDGVGPYCNAGRKEGSEISETRRIVCDAQNLRSWCLAGPERHKKCTAYPGEEILD